MRTTFEILQKLEDHCKTRGAPSRLARDLKVEKSTVTRWRNEKTIPDAMQSVLAWYLFGDPMPTLVENDDLKNALVFNGEDAKLIDQLASRAGLTRAQWIVRCIREYLAWLQTRRDWNQQKDLAKTEELPAVKTRKL